MPKTPNAWPNWSPHCDPRLPQEALRYRRRHDLRDLRSLGAINLTAWLYLDAQGNQQVLVNPNTTIAALRKEFGKAETPDAEVGVHSEGRAAEWFRTQRGVRVLQIFSERIPCPKTCAPLLKHYYPDVPWYFYYDRRSWTGGAGKGLVRSAAEVLKSAYGL